MPKIAYVPREFTPSSMAMVRNANVIIAEYQASGFSLTLRQLYYQFVSRDLLANRQTEYKRLGSVVNDARLARTDAILAPSSLRRNFRRLVRCHRVGEWAMSEPINLDALERDKHRISFAEAEKRTEGNIPHAVIPVEMLETLIAELRAARKVVEAARRVPWSGDSANLHAALADYEASQK